MKTHPSTIALKALAQAEGKEILPNVKLPVKRKPHPKGYKCDRAEDRLRPLVIEELKRLGWRVYRIENSICGKSSGVTDLLIFGDKMFFVELKSEKGTLQKNQIEFRDHCIRTNTNHLVCRSVGDIKNLGAGSSVKPGAGSSPSRGFHQSFDLPSTRI